MTIEMNGTITCDPAHRDGHTFFTIQTTQHYHSPERGSWTQPSIISGRIHAVVPLARGQQVQVRGELVHLLLGTGVKQMLDASSLQQVSNDFAEDEADGSLTALAVAHS